MHHLYGLKVTFGKNNSKLSINMANFYIKHTLILTIATYQYKTVSMDPIHHIDMKNMYMYVCMYV